MTSVPSAMTWGSPNATKHALLHGLTASSNSWHRVASGLAAQGYRVTAPNLVGHASRSATDCTIRAIAQDLRPYLKARTYSLIMGHSFGALVALALLAFLPAQRPIAIVLVDPLLYLAPDCVLFHEAVSSELCVNIKRADVYAVENPLWSREDCISREFGTRLCPAQTVNSIFEQNKPWDFFHHLQRTKSTKWKVTVVVADPARSLLCPVEMFRPFSHVRSVIVPGAGHCIPREFPEVVVEEALKTVVESEVRMPVAPRQWHALQNASLRSRLQNVLVGIYH